MNTHFDRFSRGDYALAAALGMRMLKDGLESGPCAGKCCSDWVVSYDIACGFTVNLVKRFQKYFPHLVECAKNIRWTIPRCHVRNHKIKCEEKFSSAYMGDVGHFHGETAEQPWAESNQLGAQVTQMNIGHRQDVISDSNSDWNWKKIEGMSKYCSTLLSTIHSFSARRLYKGIIDARKLLVRHLDAYSALKVVYQDCIPTWERKIKEGEIENKYFHSKTKGKLNEPHHITWPDFILGTVPSQDAIYDRLLEREAEAAKQRNSTRALLQGAVRCLKDGLEIERLQ